MNKQRRAELQKVVEMMANAKALLEEIREDEAEAFDNLPESFQESERGEQMEEYIYDMDEAIDALEENENTLTEIIEG